MDRLKALEGFYQDDPADPFNVYALAIEYLNTDAQKSLKLFEELLSNHPDYVPTYYHAAKLYQNLNEKEKSIAVYEKGLQVSLKNKDAKAHRELKAAYDELMFD
jgi:tetratricopeptide (TPR) repeat protein